MQRLPRVSAFAAPFVDGELEEDTPTYSQANRFRHWQRSAGQERDVTPSRELLALAEASRLQAVRCRREAKAWWLRAGIGLVVTLIPTPLMPFAFVFTVVAAIFAVCVGVAGANAGTAAALASTSAREGVSEASL